MLRAERTRYSAMLTSIKALMAQSREELATTRANYERQIKLLTEHCCELEDKAARGDEAARRLRALERRFNVPGSPLAAADGHAASASAARKGGAAGAGVGGSAVSERASAGAGGSVSAGRRGAALASRLGEAAAAGGAGGRNGGAGGGGAKTRHLPFGHGLSSRLAVGRGEDEAEHVADGGEERDVFQGGMYE